MRDLIKQRRDVEVMPIRVDDGDVGGLFSIDGYVDVSRYGSEALAEMILQRLNMLR